LRAIDGGSPFGTNPIPSANGICKWALACGKVLRPDDLEQPGDVFVILRAPDDKGEIHGHVGILIGKALGGDMLCVEGNAGNAVRGTKRRRADVTYVVRPVAQ